MLSFASTTSCGQERKTEEPPCRSSCLVLSPIERWADFDNSECSVELVNTSPEHLGVFTAATVFAQTWFLVGGCLFFSEAGRVQQTFRHFRGLVLPWRKTSSPGRRCNFAQEQKCSHSKSIQVFQNLLDDYSKALLHIFHHLYLSHFETLSLLGTSMWSQGTNPSLPGTGLEFWSCGSGQHSRTVSTHAKQTQSTSSFTHAIKLCTLKIRYHEKEKNGN